MPDFSPKVRALIRASEIVAAAKAERGLYPRPVAAEINRELKKISERLWQSARTALKNEAKTKYFAEHPDAERLYRQACALDGLRRAQKRVVRLSEEIRREK